MNFRARRSNIAPTPNDELSYPNRLFHTLSPTGSYVMRGDAKVHIFENTASIGGHGIMYFPTEGGMPKSLQQLFEICGQGNRFRHERIS